MKMIENDFVKFWIEDDLLFSTHKRSFSVDVEKARELVRLRHNISDNKSRYWCMNLNKLTFASREAHTYLNENGQDLLDACAVVANSFFVKFIAEVFIQIQKPKVPMRIFTSEQNAVEWLTELKNKQNNIALNVEA